MNRESKILYDLYTIEKNGNIFSKAKKASEKIGINSGDISKCCHGSYLDKRRNKWVNITQAGDFKWMYKSDYEKMIGEAIAPPTIV